MWQARQCLIMFIASFVFFSNFSWSQELPPGNLIVVTACEIAHGHSIDEVVTVARAIDYSSDGAPNAVFYRTPVSGSEFSPNWALRVVYWDDFAHFASASFPPSGPRDHLNELLTCDGNNRTFLKNYSVGSGNAYDSGANLVSGVAARFCTLSSDTSTMYSLNSSLDKFLKVFQNLHLGLKEYFFSSLAAFYSLCG